MKLYDSLTDKIVELNKNKINIYTCGPTVYLDIHIGNMRPIILTDILIRFLKYKNIEVNYVMNITDIDDKIIDRYKEENLDYFEFIKKYTNAFQLCLKEYNILKPQFIKVSDSINIITNFIKEIIKKGEAYITNDGVYFNLFKNLENYAKISKQKSDMLYKDVRIKNNSTKNSGIDFALWKFTKSGVTWKSEWGNGRPGWHTECCAIIDNHFKSGVDIHVGGVDLKFPHHENERIQFLAKNNMEISNIWLHNGSLNINKEKMSKSLGNVVLAKDFVKAYDKNTLRFLFLKSNFLNPININNSDILQAQKWIIKITKILKTIAINIKIKHIENSETNYLDEFSEYMSNNLNTPNVLSLIDKLVKDINKQTNQFNNLYEQLLTILNVLGFDFKIKNISDEDFKLYNEWNKLLKEKKFDQADLLRDILVKKGII